VLFRSHGKRLNTDQLSTKGAFAVENLDVNSVSQNLVITLGTQNFTIPKASLKKGSGKFTFTNAAVTEGGIATGEFNFTLCSFVLTIKNASIIADPGDTVSFGVLFADFNQANTVKLP
jgi:hypothetical protein